MYYRKAMVALAVFQVAFILGQVLVFYPCMTGSDAGQSWPKREQEQQQQPGFFGAGQKQKETVNNQADGRYQPTWESLDARPIPQWYDDAKVGIFIHWGVYSVPAFVGTGTNGLAEWFWYYWRHGKPEGKYHTKEAIKSVKDFVQENYPPHYTYTDMANDFTASLFEPEKWAELFQAAGAKYVVLTTKHHDGFTLWGSRRSWNWNSVDVGPHRDLVAELSTAIRKTTSLRFGAYHSLYEWFNPLYKEDREGDYSTRVYVKDKLMPELYDLVTKYRPDIVWADGEWEAPSSYWNTTHFLAWLYNDSPVKDRVVVNDRWGSDANCKHGGYLTCEDRWNPGEKGEKPWRKWENCMTIDQESWGYRRNAELEDYLDMNKLTRILAQTVSHGGNLLMNVGPTSDGRIPPILEERLRQMGQWLKVNGEGIYATRMWNPTKEPNSNNVYYTRKDGTDDGTVVYAILLVWPDNNKLQLKATVPSQQTTVTWLGYKEALVWERTEGGGITVTLPNIQPNQIPCQWAWVFKLTKLGNAL